MNKRLILSLFVLALLAVEGAVGQNVQIDLAGPLLDWRAQDYEDSQGITAVHYDENQDCLILDCELIGGHSNKSKGEIVLDLKYIPYLEANVPVNMTNRLIEVEINIPTEFVGDPNAPNGCQVFVKDNEYRTQYGTWENCTSAGTLKISLQPSTENPYWGYTETGFDPENIREIGVKISINKNSTHQSSVSIKICKVEVTPSLPFPSPPELPGGQPMPFVTAESNVDIQADGFYIGSQKWFIAGGNWRLIEYRQNFGATDWYPKGNGISIHPNYVANKLELFRQAGVTLVRVGLLDDGTTMFDKEGNVVGYNVIFKNDVSSFLDLAAQYDMKVEFVLVDFLIAGKGEECNGVWLRGRREIIEDPQVRQQFIENFLEPFLNAYGNDPAVFGFDIINEPEWIIAKADGGGWEDVTDVNKAETPISIEQFRNFVNECTEKIHELAAEKFVTVGVSCPNTDLLENLNLDYSSVHYYSWMGNLESNLSKDFGDNPWSLEEFPGQGDIYDYFETVFENGGAGALLWNLSPEIDEQCYFFDKEEEKLQEIRRFVDYAVTLLPVISPTISLNRTELYFGAVTYGMVSDSQTILLTNSNGGTLNWSISDDAGWLSCSPDSGTGTGVVTVSADPAGLVSGIYTGIITVSDPNATNSPQTVSVTLDVKAPGAEAAPFGYLATPLNGSTVRSSVPVTGWALDDLGVESVKIYHSDGKNLVYIGDAVFVEGARPDIETAYQGYPKNYQAGWGYMLLSNFLPNQGNGTFILHAIATDIEGNQVTLGTSTITCDNANAIKPFGAIDTPTQGGTASGTAFINWGWALTPQPNYIPTDGSTIHVIVDGVNIGQPTYNNYRADIALLFPNYANTNGAVGYFYLDTTLYSSGVHTAQWTVTDSAGNTDGIGSRYFTIRNTDSGDSVQQVTAGYKKEVIYPRKSHISEIPTNDAEPIEVKKGLVMNPGQKRIEADKSGSFQVVIRELDPIEIHLSPNSQAFDSYAGYMMVGDELRSLPVGSTLNLNKGILYWQPGVGFLGDYQLIFIRNNRSGNREKKIVTVRIIQKHARDD